MVTHEIPSYLKRYTTEQDYSLYSYEDQAVWRFTMRQLFEYLKNHAHSAYIDGLNKTGLSIESIPKISEMDEKLQDFGWRAVGVSGFIPPAAFMSLQAHKILPIACEIRTLDQILYTPAPDIIHEAAGHAPILVDTDFTNYLNSYGEVASKAIISSEDLALYEAIRDLSDIKGESSSTDSDIKKAEVHLEHISKSMTYVSEAQYLGRMNWWTAEYGLIGTLDNPKIYGAGLLSSIAEARNCLTKPKHIRFDINCLEHSYDITEQQPQLFVVERFEDLISELNEMKSKMAFSIGGSEALAKAKKAQTVCTVVLNNGKSLSGIVKDYKIHGHNNEAKNETASLQTQIKEIQFLGPCLINSEKLIEQEHTELLTTEKVVSVYGGPSNFERYPHFTDFVAKKVNKNTPKNKESESLLKDIHFARATNDFNFKTLKEKFFETSKDHWLCGLELLELNMDSQILNHLETLKLENSKNTKSPTSTSNPKGQSKTCIDLGLTLLKS